MGQSSKKNPDQTPPESPPEEVGSLLAELLQGIRGGFGNFPNPVFVAQHR